MFGAGKMVHPVKVLPSRPDHLSLISGTYMGREKTDTTKFSFAVHICTMACIHLRVHAGARLVAHTYDHSHGRLR